MVSLQFVNYRFWGNVREKRWEGTTCPLQQLKYEHLAARVDNLWKPFINKYAQLQSSELKIRWCCEEIQSPILNFYWYSKASLDAYGIMEINVNLWKIQMLHNVTVSQDCYAWVQQINPKEQLNWEYFRQCGVGCWMSNVLCELTVRL